MKTYKEFRQELIDEGLADWWNIGRKPGENTMRWGNPRDLIRKDTNKVNPNTLFGNDRLQRGQSNVSYDSGQRSRILGRPDRAVLGVDLDPRSPDFLRRVPAERGGPGSAPTSAIRQGVERPLRTLGRVAGTLRSLTGLTSVPAVATWAALEGGFPSSTARYDQTTGPNAYYNNPKYTGPRPKPPVTPTQPQPARRNPVRNTATVSKGWGTSSADLDRILR